MNQHFSSSIAVLLFFWTISLSTARPRDFYLNRNNENYLRRFLKSFAIGSEELFCPRTSVDSASSVTNDTLATLTGMEPACGRDYDLCSDDLDCGPGLMCCPSGCIYKCVVPEAPKAAVATDWLEEPEALTVGGNSWLIEDGSSSNPSQHEIECSTSVFPGIEPLNCMSGYTCSIQTPEDVQHQIPNRGICIRTALPDASKPLGPLFDPLSYGGEVEATKEAPCLLNGKEVPHGYHDTVDCNLCFCKDGDLFCQMQPCLN